MDIPEWVAEYVLERASLVEGRLLLALFLHGKPVVGGDGARRLYWKASNDDLLRGAKCSRQGMIDARRALEQDGVLTVHKSSRHKTPSAISAPVERPEWGLIDEEDSAAWGLTIRPHTESVDASRGLTIRPQSRFKSAHHDDDPSTPTLSGEISGSSSSSPILGELAEIGVTNPEAMVKRFGEQHCRQALDQFRAIDAGSVRNPAGLLHHLASTPTTPYGAVQTSEDPLEAAKKRFLGGRLGHIVRYR